jgi:hypothetical protein
MFPWQVSSTSFRISPQFEGVAALCVHQLDKNLFVIGLPFRSLLLRDTSEGTSYSFTPTITQGIYSKGSNGSFNPFALQGLQF